MENRMRGRVSFCLVCLVLLLGVRYSLPASAQTSAAVDRVPRSGFLFSLGGSFNGIRFGDQEVIAVGTSDLTKNGVTVLSGYADGPDDATGGTPIPIDSRVAFAPSVEVGYFRHFAGSDWLWGARFSHTHFGAASTYRAPRLPQVGYFIYAGSSEKVPFTGNALAVSMQSVLVDQMDLMPFIGRSFEKGFVHFGVGPTVSLARTEITDLVGFADINGVRSDISGAPQDFLDSGWILGGAAQVGLTHFLDASWFTDVSYSYAATRNHAFDFASTFTNTTASGVTTGTLTGSSTWNTVTQGFALKVGKSF